MSTDQSASTDDRRHPPFAPGNRVGELHGARSERRIAPLAVEVERAARADPSWPSYLDDAGYASAVAAWARAEAIVSLLWSWLAEQDLDAAVASTTEQHTDTETTEEAGGLASRTRSRSSSRHVDSALSQLDRWERAAAKQRQRLGLDPLSRARLGRDVASAQHDLSSYLSNLAEQRDADQAATRPEITADDPTALGEGPGKGEPA